MIQRLELCEIEEETLEIEINISEVVRQIENTFTYLGALSNITLFTIQRIDMLGKARKNVGDLIGKVVSKMNPDTNDAIKLKNQENDSHKWLMFHIGKIREKLEVQGNDMNRLLSNENIETNRVMNKVMLESHASYIENVLDNLIINSLREALLEYKKNPIINIGEEKIEVKGEEYFWYLVFSNFYNSSKVLGYLNPSEVRDINKYFSGAQSSQKLTQTPQTGEGEDYGFVGGGNEI